MIAKYDLGSATHPATFDFFTWLVVVQAMGATKIALANINNVHCKHGEPLEAFERIDSIIKPGIAFSGLPWMESDEGEMLFDRIHMTAIPDNFPRLKTVLPPRDIKYTVTIRNMTRKPIRNSNPYVWKTFARNIGAYLIDDWSVKRICLHKRMALYAGAKMNFGVPNGPLSMLFLTDYPYMMVNCAAKMKHWFQHGINRGDQIRWAKPNQILSWDEEVTVEDLMEKFEAFENGVEDKRERACQI